MLIQDKKLPKTVEQERQELYASKKGKELLAGAQQLQNEIQGIADRAMSEAKQKKGTTGMNFNELDNVLDKLSEHSYAPAVAATSKTSAAVARYIFKNGKFVCVHDPNPGRKNKLWKPLFPQKS